MNDRDTFAAAALTGLLANHPVYGSDYAPKRAYELADAMLRERERTNHDAAPAARATTKPGGLNSGSASGTSGDSSPVTKPSSGTGGPANRDTTQPRNGAVDEPVAWAVVSDSTEQIDCEFVYPDAATAGDVALDSNGGVVPLYRAPTLTDAEREAVEWCVSRPQTHWQHGIYAATLRGLLERLK